MIGYTQPIVKWAGGKTQLLDRLLPHIDADITGTYYEPFVGGGAVLLNQRHTHVVAGDVNPSLVGMYQQVAAAPDDVAEALQEIYAPHPDDGDGAYFYALRKEYNAYVRREQFDVRHAALFITMTKWGFNGLYRLNRKGEFNASFCKKYRDLPDQGRLQQAAAKLTQVTWRVGDFATIIADVKPGDTVFLDPPYHPLPGAVVVNYAPRAWLKTDHQRVADTAHDLASMGVHVVATNHNLPEIHGMYEGLTITPVEVSRRIRGGQTRAPLEVIITN